MNTIKHFFYIWITIILISTVSGCSHTGKQTVAEKRQKTYSEIHDATLKLVSDPERAQQVMKLVDQQLDLITQFQNEQKTLMKELNALDVNYDSTNVEYHKVFTSQDKVLAGYQKSAIAIHQQLMKSLTAEEFKKLKKVRDDAVETYLMTIQ